MPHVFTQYILLLVYSYFADLLLYSYYVYGICWILILPLLRFIDVIEIEVVDLEKSSCWIS